MIPNLVDLVENSEPEEPGSLYSLSAVLMDGDSGRILYQKDGEVPRPNASTTKVLTCILALENGSGDDYVSVSKNAASQPEVREESATFIPRTVSYKRRPFGVGIMYLPEYRIYLRSRSVRMIFVRVDAVPRPVLSI